MTFARHNSLPSQWCTRAVVSNLYGLLTFPACSIRRTNAQRGVFQCNELEGMLDFQTCQVVAWSNVDFEFYTVGMYCSWFVLKTGRSHGVLSDETDVCLRLGRAVFVSVCSDGNTTFSEMFVPHCYLYTQECWSLRFVDVFEGTSWHRLELIWDNRCFPQRWYPYVEVHGVRFAWCL